MKYCWRIGINIKFIYMRSRFGAGVGLAKKQELKQYKSQVELKLIREIKKTIDPNNIMNPGKVL